MEKDDKMMKDTVETATEEVAEEVAEEATEEIAEECAKETAEESVNEPQKESFEAPTSQKKAEGAVVSLTLKRWHLIVAAALLVALVGGGVLLGMLLAPQGGIDRDAVNYPWAPPNGGGEAGEIALPGYEKITLPAGKSEVDIVLPNPTGNPCNFWFTLVLRDTGEVLYQSGIIPPGMAVTHVTLARPLAVGDYPLEIRIRTASVDEGVPMNGATLSVTLEVR